MNGKRGYFVNGAGTRTEYKDLGTLLTTSAIIKKSLGVS